jgi:ribose 5-phosphate isomerase B
MTPIALGSDDAGARLRHAVARHLDDLGVQYHDYGFDEPDPAYPRVAVTVAQAVAAGEHERAILICGTGIGMAISANKVRGVYAAVGHDPYSAERARKSNNAQILALGARVVGVELALMLVDIWLASEFDASRSGAKIAELSRLEQEVLTPETVT